jgi:hypothetical protein
MANPKRPRDTNQLAKFITEIATGDKENDQTSDDVNIAHNGQRLGGLKGGKARAEKLTPEQRKAISQKALKKRWNK